VTCRATFPQTHTTSKRSLREMGRGYCRLLMVRVDTALLLKLKHVNLVGLYACKMSPLYRILDTLDPYEYFVMHQAFTQCPEKNYPFDSDKIASE